MKLRAAPPSNLHSRSATDYRPQVGVSHQSRRQTVLGQSLRAVRLLADQRRRFYNPLHSVVSGPLLFAIIVMTAAIIGWLNRDEGYLTPEEGIGYWLGIVGGSLMLLLLVYPLRKRLPSLRAMGPVTFWFRLHMLAGVIGPLLVVWHANFKFGSLNSTIAMMSMLMVAFSGLIGRYLYGKLHKGLYGQQAQVREILADATVFKQSFGADLEDIAQIAREMQMFEQRLLKPHHNLLAAIGSMIFMRSEAHLCEARLKRLAKTKLALRAKQSGWKRRELRQHIHDANKYLRLYFSALNKAAGYQIYVRLFSLWHILHLPLFFFLILAAIVHIIAVHLY